jgi:hypothetical protein
MATNINQIPDTVLTRDQRFLINTYLSMYNSTIRQIDLLYNNLDEIRESIDYIVTTSLHNNAQTVERTRTRTRTRNTEQRPTIDAPRLSSIPSSPPATRTNTSRGSAPLAGEEIFEFTFVPRDTHRLTNELQNIFRNFYNPVPIAPTLDQINNATRSIRFSEITNPVNTTCPISLERFTSEQSVCQIKYCSHIFNRTQLNAWFSNNPRCPVCRYDIRDYIERNTTNLVEEPEPITSEEEEKTQEPVRNLENTIRQQNSNRNGSENVLADLSTNITNLLMSDLLRNERATLSFDFFPLDGSNNSYSILNDIFNPPPPPPPPPR